MKIENIDLIIKDDEIILNIKTKLVFAILTYVALIAFECLFIWMIFEYEGWGSKLVGILSAVSIPYIFSQDIITSKDKGLYFTKDELTIKGFDSDGFKANHYTFNKQNIERIRYAKTKLTEIILKEEAGYSFQYYDISIDPKIINPILRIWMKANSIEEMKALLAKEESLMIDSNH